MKLDKSICEKCPHNKTKSWEKDWKSKFIVCSNIECIYTLEHILSDNTEEIKIFFTASVLKVERRLGKTPTQIIFDEISTVKGHK